MTPEEIEMLIAVSDPDGVYAMLMDQGFIEEANYIENKYFI
jgi:hypothetical protein